MILIFHLNSECYALFMEQNCTLKFILHQQPLLSLSLRKNETIEKIKMVKLKNMAEKDFKELRYISIWIFLLLNVLNPVSHLLRKTRCCSWTMLHDHVDSVDQPRRSQQEPACFLLLRCECFIVIFGFMNYTHISSWLWPGI